MKKIIKAAALSVSILALASTANAAVKELNIYGASAEYTFWTAFARDYLVNVQGCKDDKTDPVNGTTSSADASNHGMTIGHQCGATQDDTIIIRYTSKNSIEGVRAAAGMNVTDGTSECGSNTALGQRLMAGDTQTSHPSDADHPEIWFTNDTTCRQIDVGASDVSLKSFVQLTMGNSNGLNDNTNHMPGAKNFKSYNLRSAAQGPPAATAFADDHIRQPIIVPFSFYANTDLPVDNLNRQQIIQLMSGKIFNWKMFGSSFPDARVAVCHRHAGSGTRATLDMAVMRGFRGDDLTLSTGENYTQYSLATPRAEILFHDGTGGVMQCIENNAYGANIGTMPTIAVGYADSDSNVKSVTNDGVETNTNLHIKRLLYNGSGEGLTSANKGTYGYSAVKYEIGHGSYDFWSAQWMYLSNSADTNVQGLFTSLMDYAQTANLDTCTAAFKTGCYWMNNNDTHQDYGSTNEGKWYFSKGSDTAAPFFQKE